MRRGNTCDYVLEKSVEPRGPSPLCERPESKQPATPMCRGERTGFHVRRDKAALFQSVQGPPGDSLPPEAIGAGMQETKCLEAFG